MPTAPGSTGRSPQPALPRGGAACRSGSGDQAPEDGRVVWGEGGTGVCWEAAGMGCRSVPGVVSPALRAAGPGGHLAGRFIPESSQG